MRTNLPNSVTFNSNSASEKLKSLYTKRTLFPRMNKDSEKHKYFTPINDNPKNTSPNGEIKYQFRINGKKRNID